MENWPGVLGGLEMYPFFPFYIIALELLLFENLLSKAFPGIDNVGTMRGACILPDVNSWWGVSLI